MSKPEYTRELVAFLHRLQPRDLPAEVLDRARGQLNEAAAAYSVVDMVA